MDRTHVAGAAMIAFLACSCEKKPAPSPPADPGPAPVVDRTSSSGSTIAVERGSRFSITLYDSSGPISPDNRTTWETPEVTGKAIRYEGRGPGEALGGGGRMKKSFLFEALEPGDAHISIPIRVGPKAEDRPTDYSLRVTVR